MTDPDPYGLADLDHARHAVTLTTCAKASCEPKWRWMPAMMDTNLHRITHVHGDGHASTDKSGVRPVHLRGRLPLLSDHGTLGALEYRLIPDAWGPEVTIMHVDGPRVKSTTVSNGAGAVLFRATGPKVERLIATLDAAP